MSEKAQKAKFLSIISILAGIYVVTAMLPFPTVFVGGSGNMNMGLIGSVLVGAVGYSIFPRIVHTKSEELTAIISVGVISGIISSFISPFNFAGFFYIFIPLAGITATYLSLKGGFDILIPLIWISTVMAFMWFSYQLYLINIPHIIAIVVGLALIAITRIKTQNKKLMFIQVPLAIVVGTIAEWCVLNLFATVVLALPRDLWFVIMPLVFIERSTAIIFGTLFSIPAMKALENLSFE
ncbi:MAG: hypothetical protein ACP6IU_00710 [Candidatus Asgardarchaeia archaeon]